MFAVPGSSRKERPLGLLLFGVCFLLYALCSPGNLPGDTETRWSVARQFVRTAGVSIEESVQTRNYAIGTDGLRHSVWNPGQAFLFLPFAGLGKLLEDSGLLTAKLSDLSMQFLVSVVFFPLIGAALVLLSYQLLRSLNYSERSAGLTAVAIGILSPMFHYSVNTQEESQVAVLLLLSVGVLQYYRGKHSLRTRFLACALFGFAIFIRSSALPVVLPLYLAACLDEVFSAPRSKRFHALVQWILAGCLGTAPFAAAVCLHNYVRFSDIFEHGYQDAVSRRYGLSELFAARPLPTIAAVLFSPGKGLIWYCPILLLAFFGLPAMYRKFPFLIRLCFLAALGGLLFNSFFTIWAGDLAWGPRFQTSVLPLLLLPLAEIFSQEWHGLKRIFINLILCLSLLVQSASVVYNFNLEFWQNPLHGPVPDEYTWEPGESHLFLRFENIAYHLIGTPRLEVETFATEDPHVDRVNRSRKQLQVAHSLNFFPFKARALLNSSSKIITPLFLLWFTLFFALLILGARLLPRLLSSSQQELFDAPAEVV